MLQLHVNIFERFLYRLFNLPLTIGVLLLLSFQYLLVIEGRTSDGLKVELEHGGILVGRYLSSVNGRHMRAFMGVPYAKPPLDSLRFKAPVPYGSWNGELHVVKDSAKCTQRDPFRRDMELEGSEDCLYLNVYRPEEPRTKTLLPVMVWFHGGGWECGSGISAFYGPDYFMDHDVILISANFRLGPLGFLSTETVDCPGNFGLKDQLEVLKWIQSNIGAFGGDANSVTIFGESAGGASVTYHMLSEKSKGLFHKGIAQSGTYFNPWAQPAHQGIPAKRTRQLAKLVNCPTNTDWPEILDCLRTKSAKDITATIYDLFEWDYDPMIPFPPVVEPQHNDAFLTVLPRSAANPHGFSLPLLIGATSEEGILKTAAILNEPGLQEDFTKNFYKVLPIILNYDHHSKQKQDDLTSRIENFYFKNGHNYNKKNHQNLTDLMSDGWFLAGIDEYLRLRIKDTKMSNQAVAPTYVYLFSHKGAASFSEIFKGGREDYYGACHAEELQYLFPVGKELFVSATPTNSDIQLRNAMLSLWVSFANSSIPNPNSKTGDVNWEPSIEYPVKYIQIGDKSEENWKLLQSKTELFQDRVDFWKELNPHVPAIVSTDNREEL